MTPPAGDGPAAAAEEERATRLHAATARALSDVPELTLRGGRPYRGARPLDVHAPHVVPFPRGADDASRRGAADALARRVAASDPALHTRLRPEHPVARLLFEALEQFRVEARPPADLPGVARNLRRRYVQWARSVHHQGLTATHEGLLVYTALEMCRARLTGQPALEETAGLLEEPRGALAPVLGRDLAGMRRHLDDQAAFARHALALAAEVARRLPPPRPGARGHREDDEDRSPLAPLLEGGAPPGPPDGALGGSSEQAAGSGPDAGGYRVFTREYDRQRTAGQLVRPARAREYRTLLDERIARDGAGLGRLTRALRAVLAAPAPQGRRTGMEEGVVDGRLLARLVASPAERAVFHDERHVPHVDALVTFLVDCSGSMKRHRERLATFVDVSARALESAGAACEILGFTTAAWNGGRARRDWIRAGRPARPGRLNERLHIVLKPAATPWRRARTDIAALLVPDLYREGVDGEAVAWARERARAVPARRRILVVLSDGGPMDSATALANAPGLLDLHLQQAVHAVESEADGEILALGTGGDLTPYYSRVRTMEPSSETERARGPAPLPAVPAMSPVSALPELLARRR